MGFTSCKEKRSKGEGEEDVAHDHKRSERDYHSRYWDGMSCEIMSTVVQLDKSLPRSRGF